MSKTYVLQALRVFGFDEMERLSQLARNSKASMKKAAGAELVVWDEPSQDEKPSSKHSSEQTEQKDNILHFTKFASPPLEAQASAEVNELEHPSEEAKNFNHGDFLLWQRELGREAPKNLKSEAAKGYARSTEMYVVKTPSVEGKEKIRFAATNGVLINKKQA